MNLRQYTHETYIPWHYQSVEVRVPQFRENFWGTKVFDGYKTEKKDVYVDCKTHKETRIEFLNPETLKWEPLPTKTDEFCVPRAALKVE